MSSLQSERWKHFVPSARESRNSVNEFLQKSAHPDGICDDACLIRPPRGTYTYMCSETRTCLYHLAISCRTRDCNVSSEAREAEGTRGACAKAFSNAE